MALVLSEMLTDRPPYEGREAMDFHLAAMSPKRPTPGHVGVDVGAWEPVLARALALFALVAQGVAPFLPVLCSRRTQALRLLLSTDDEA